MNSKEYIVSLVGAALLIGPAHAIEKSESRIKHDSCVIKTVRQFEGYSNSVRPYIERILTKKGFVVEADGYLFKTYDVPFSDLQIRDDLLVSGTLVGVVSSFFSDNDDVMCTVWKSGDTTCDFRFSLYEVNEDRSLKLLAEVKNSKPEYWSSASFFREILHRAKKALPECEVRY